MTYSGWEIYTKIHDPGDTSTLDGARDASSGLKTIHENVVRTLTESQAKLNAFWKGKAADAGTAGLTPLIQSSQIVAENMDRAHRSMQEQSDAFSYVMQHARPVAKDRPNDQKLSDYVSIGASDDEKAAAQFDSDTKFNVELYEPYYQSTQPRKSTLAPNYPAAHDPNVSATGITPDPSTPGTATGRIGSGVGHHSSGGTAHSYGGGSSNNYSSGPSTYSAPPGAAGMQAPPPPGHGGAVTPPVPPPNDTTRAAWADPTPPTPPPTWQPPAVSPGGGNPGTGGMSGGFGPVGFGPTSGGGFGPGGSGSAGSGGAGSGAGPRGIGGGAGPRGVGGGTGAGALGEGATARPGGAGAAGAKGQPGMGGMGGGKGGKGPEDEEHQRKILLAEEDPDSIFGGYDGNRPTPPVIGA
ncbi:hypothetical protein [Amycolatopsis orientalis]|uniref:hypothetical protein n=1 Tax=Amycolatopsis orientalis TaxID=31958 RepID=UPI0003A27E8A|nr:hypothetical protein [Amycolatopsis orientalis]